MQVTYFHRNPRPQANFSIEQVFEGVRQELTGRIDARVCVAPVYSNGVLRRLWIAWHAWRHQGEINHVTGDTNFTALALDGKRTVLTIHDCGNMLRTHGLRRRLFRQFWLRLPVRHAAAVTTVSNASKTEIIRFTGCPPEKIHVIPNAVPRAFKLVSRPFHAERPRILHVGTAPNKNLARLIDALAGLPCRLVIVGKLTEAVRRQLQDVGIEFENHVDLPVPDLVHQYEECDLVAFVSLYEGFGVPILEAQAVGRPLVTSDRLPMSEIAGEGACLVDPMEARAIRAGIDRLIGDREFRCRVIDRGFENIKRYQPERIAGQYLALYEQVLADANRS